MTADRFADKHGSSGQMAQPRSPAYLAERPEKVVVDRAFGFDNGVHYTAAKRATVTDPGRLMGERPMTPGRGSRRTACVLPSSGDQARAGQFSPCARVNPGLPSISSSFSTCIQR